MPPVPDLKNVVDLMALGRHAEALAAVTDLLRRRPRDPELLAIAGEAAIHAGRLVDARRHFQKLGRLQPGRAEVWAALGYVHHRLEDFAAAAQAYGRAAERAPGVPEYVYNQALALAAGGEREAARERFEATLALAPTHVGAMRGLGTALRELGRPLEGVPFLKHALDTTPEAVTAATVVDYAEATLGTLDLPEALSAVEAALPGARRDPDSLARIAHIFSRMERADDAADTVARAISLDPETPALHCDAAAIAIDGGRPQDAAAHYRNALDRDPGYAQAFFGLSQLRTFRTDDAEDRALVERMRAALDRAVAEPALLHFALGKAFDDLGETDAAFAHWRRGNEIRKAERPHDRAKFHDRIRRLTEAFPVDEPTAAPPPAQVSPIFICGMPRSGTTLVEQILASHPDVAAGGEQMLMPYIVASLTHRHPGPPPADAMATAGDLYRTRIGHLARGRPRVTDKLPFNVFNAGAILGALPDTRLIMLRRDPRDVGLSCYATAFQSGMEFSYDLGDIADTVKCVDAVIRHWLRAAPGRVREIVYENLIAEPEAEIRALLDFCGLHWDPACLRFHETRRRTGTASALQVARPLYRSSRARWRPYAAHLGPLLDGLDDDAEDRTA